MKGQLSASFNRNSERNCNKYLSFMSFCLLELQSLDVNVVDFRNTIYS